MRVTVNIKDIEALRYAIEHLGTAIKESGDGIWKLGARKMVRTLRDLQDRYWLERAKADEARALVRRLNSHFLHPKEVDKLARATLREKRKSNQNKR